MGNNNFIWSKVHNPWTFIHVQIQRSGEGGGGLDYPLQHRKPQSYRFPSEYCSGPLANHKATQPVFGVGPSSF